MCSVRLGVQRETWCVQHMDVIEPQKSTIVLQFLNVCLLLPIQSAFCYVSLTLPLSATV